jgi:hypothetical protein
VVDAEQVRPDDLADGAPDELLPQRPRQVHQVSRLDLRDQLRVPVGVHEDERGPDLGIEPLEAVEDHGVERAEHDVPVRPVLPDDLHGSLLHPSGLEAGHLQLDHEDAAPLRRADKFFEGADRGSPHRRLELGAEVEGEHLLQSFVLHAAGVGGEPVDAQIVEDDHLAVPRELAVHIHPIHARLERALHGVEAVVGGVIAEPAVGKDERSRRLYDE